MGKGLLILILLVATLTSRAQDLEPSQLIVDAIECSGNEDTSCEVIRREIYLSEGEQLDEEELANAKIRLQLLALFKSVNLRLEKGTERGHVKLIVEVEEVSPFFTETHIGLPEAMIHHAGINFKLGHRNVFGRGKILQLTLNPGSLTGHEDHSPSRSASLEYIDPHLFGQKRFFLSDRISYSKSKNRYGSSSYAANTLTLGARIFDFSYITLSHVHDQFRYLGGKHETNRFRAGFGWNTQDDPYFVSEGSKVELSHTFRSRDYQVASQRFEGIKTWSSGKNVYSLGSSIDYTKTTGYLSVYTSAGFEYARQMWRGSSDGKITDMRWFVSPGVLQSHSDSTGDSAFNYQYLTLNAGVTLMSTQLGLVKVGLSYNRGGL